MSGLRNPVERRPDGFYAALGRRFSLRGAHWGIGPYKRRSDAEVTAGLAARNFTHVDVVRPEGQAGVYVQIAGGWRLKGPPVIGPFDSRREAAAVLGKLQPPGWRPPDGAGDKLVPVLRPHLRGEHGNRATDQTMPEAGDPAVDGVIGALRGLGSNKADALYSARQARATLGPSADEDALLREAFRQSRESLKAKGEAMASRAASNPRRPSEPCPACGYAVRLPKRDRTVTCRHCGAESRVA